MAGIAGMGEVVRPMGQLTEHVSNNYWIRGDHRGLRRPVESPSASSSRAC
jgi:hypothetical protein